MALYSLISMIPLFGPVFGMPLKYLHRFIRQRIKERKLTKERSYYHAIKQMRDVNKLVSDKDFNLKVNPFISNFEEQYA